MAGKSKTSFAKRQREKKKAERASEKRERRGQREASAESHPVADADDLAALGIEVPGAEGAENEDPI